MRGFLMMHAKELVEADGAIRIGIMLEAAGLIVCLMIHKVRQHVRVQVHKIPTGLCLVSGLQILLAQVEGEEVGAIIRVLHVRNIMRQNALIPVIVELAIGTMILTSLKEGGVKEQQWALVQAVVGVKLIQLLALMKGVTG